MQAAILQNQSDALRNMQQRLPSILANRIAMLANAIKIEEDICMTGGVAKNDGVVNALGKILGRRIKKIRKTDPQLIGAVGAALLAFERLG